MDILKFTAKLSINIIFDEDKNEVVRAQRSSLNLSNYENQTNYITINNTYQTSNYLTVFSKISIHNCKNEFSCCFSKKFTK